MSKQKLPLSELPEKLEKDRWIDIDKLLLRDGPFKHEYFTPGKETKDFLQNICRVLIIGAGGLGCDLVKNLAMSGFRNIDIIDMDTIDLSNLNRQFLFRNSDIGKSKSEVAAEFVNKRVPGCKVTAHNCRIQQKDLDFYKQFHIVVSGLDSIKARRWINSTLVGLVEVEEDETIDMSTVKMFVDGGTEGFKGQARVITPQVSACFECTMDLFPPQTTFASCTIANTPRMPEHCVVYIMEKIFPITKDKKIIRDDYSQKGKKITIKIKDDEQFDGDNMDHVQWVYERALERAKDYNIRGVTYRFTQGVVKNIIPAIASTNAVVASICANECLKLATLLAPAMNDYMMYNGNEGVYTFTYKTDKKKECYTCGIPPAIEFNMKKSDTLRDLLDKIKEHPAIQFSDPFITDEDGGNVYNTSIPFFKEQSLEDEDKTLEELKFEDGANFNVVDTQVMKEGGFVITLKY